jgi:uncharacterized protein (DUF924 family)
MPIKTPDSIRQFWFGDAKDDLVTNQTQAPLWWGKSQEEDALITAEFADTLQTAIRGELDEWANTPTSRLALIIVLDQFPRVIHRDTREAFACDPIARRHCLAGIAAEQDHALRPIARIFFYLPLEHSEDLAQQAQGMECYQALADSGPPAHRELFANTVSFAASHRDIIARFGRFPHRNRILGRESTAEELAFLQQPGSSF